MGTKNPAIPIPIKSLTNCKCSNETSVVIEPEAQAERPKAINPTVAISLAPILVMLTPKKGPKKRERRPVTAITSPAVVGV